MAEIIDINDDALEAPLPKDDGPAPEADGATRRPDAPPRACGGCCRRGPRHNIQSFDYLAGLPGVEAECDLVEVAFKNTRKAFFRNERPGIDVSVGDMVVVDSGHGTDLGTVTMKGPLVLLQMKRARVKPDSDIKRLLRRPTPRDLEKYEEAKAREDDTMVRARRIAEELKLNMKIGDVEYTGDGTKAIFYYIADERVDFRQLIKVLAETFKVRVEMKQIGARQEAGRIGGIGPCGRPLCCATWMTNFVSVGTASARYQDLSLNPQKLAGQCAKLKCCLNFEIDAYIEAVKQLPPRDVRLETADATWYHFKTDVFRKEVTYSSDKKMAANLTTLTAERVFEIIEINKAGEKPLTLKPEGDEAPKKAPGFVEIVGQDSLTRFDKKKKKKKKKPAQGKPSQGGGKPEGDGQAEGGQPIAKPAAPAPQPANPAPQQPQGGQQPAGGDNRRRKPKQRPHGGNGGAQPQQPA